MKFEGVEELAAPREKVWSLVRDPSKLGSALGDVRDLEIVSPTVFRANVKVGVSVIRGTFHFRFETVEETRPSHLVLVAQGKGIGSAVDLRVVVDLSDADGGQCRLAWSATAQVAGALAGIGQRLIDQSAEKTIRETFANLRAVAAARG